MQLRKPNHNDDEKEIKDIINKNIASPFKTQQPFAELLLLNGCSKIKLGLIGSKIRKELLYEAENEDLTADDVMPRAYELIGKFLKISDVTTFDDIGIENSNHEIISKKENNKLLKQKDIEEKFGVDLTNKQWFQCTIEEIKYSTFSNQPQRNIDNAYVIINEDNFEIIKESVWLKSNMGTRRLYFYNMTSLDFDARGKLHTSSSVIINTKGAEHVQLKFVTKEDFDLMNNAFESYLEKTHQPQQNIPTTSNADELLKYAELYEKGLLTKEEFDMKKAELLGNPNADEYSFRQESSPKNNVTTEYTPNFCPNCGTPVETVSNFCRNCGNRLR
ncbi:MAG: zinc-ribbon domain-containing protein [Methanobrevibacter sp.]|uniref:zinc-ribbon domain-containing protein n=1 Tax=Methanobrevibacter sp. TaxID=66852 RepID=UPI002E75EAE1|nr:zinc-ribbon domain-containing protein [Methanobrevibacter sp.]MEE0942688.1 zinc-ribbon domain-containing protein [Methanobrevibacter sp.]